MSLLCLDKNDLDKEKLLEIFNSTGEKIKTIDITGLNQTTNNYKLADEDIESAGMYLVQLIIDGVPAGSCKIVKK